MHAQSALNVGKIAVSQIDGDTDWTLLLYKNLKGVPLPFLACTQTHTQIRINAYISAEPFLPILLPWFYILTFLISSDSSDRPTYFLPFSFSSSSCYQTLKGLLFQNNFEK